MLIKIKMATYEKMIETAEWLDRIKPMVQYDIGHDPYTVKQETISRRKYFGIFGPQMPKYLIVLDVHEKDAKEIMKHLGY
jgi:hypothetical protein